MDQVLDDAKGRKAKETVQEYVRREPDAVTLVHELLTDAGVSVDRFMANAFVQKLDDIERIDRLITTAESRRDASLREIERRRVFLGETLRRSVQEIEDGEPGPTLTRKPKTSRVKSPKRRSICAACDMPAINCYPKHWPILTMITGKRSGRASEASCARTRRTCR
jgi:hypothetical protein